MKMFLAHGKIEERHYRNDTPRYMEEFRIIMAESEYDALAKYEAYWESQSVDYSVSYYVTSAKITETLE
jgi:hypothetical protein